MLILLTAGCLEQTPAGCCQTEASPRTAASLAAFVFDQCIGLAAGLDRPPPSASFVPGAFRPSGPMPPLVRLGVDAFRCQRIVGPQRVSSEVAFLWSHVRVQPRNASWTSAGFSFYLDDALVSDELVANELRAAGLPAVHASFEKSEQALPLGGARETWSFRAANSSYQVEWQHDGGPGTASAPFDRSLWTGQGPFARFDVREWDRPFGVAGLEVATVTVEGDTRFAAALGVSPVAMTAQTAAYLRWEFQSEPLKFQEEHSA